jgi:hypothetical protein
LAVIDCNSSQVFPVAKLPNNLLETSGTLTKVGLDVLRDAFRQHFGSMLKVLPQTALLSKYLEIRKPQ